MTGHEPVKLLQPDLRRALLDDLKDVEAASSATVNSAVAVVVQMLGHNHEEDDVHCDNLVGVLGQRSKYLIARLLQVEEELHQERSGSRPDVPQPPVGSPEPGAAPVP